MSLFLIQKNRIVCISDRTVVITAYILGLFVGLIAKKVIQKLKKKQTNRFPNPGGSQFDIELFNDNEIGYVILSCISDHEQFIVRDPKLNQLIFSLIKAKIKDESIIIHPNLLRFIATRLIKPNTGLIAKIGNLIISSHKSKVAVQTISAFVIGISNIFFKSLPYAALAMVLMVTSTKNCYPCDKYFEKLTPSEQENFTRLYADRAFGNLFISNNDLSRQLEIFIPSGAAETTSEILNDDEVIKTTKQIYGRSRKRARTVQFDDFKKNDSQLNKFNQLEEPIVEQTPCLHEAIEAIIEAASSLE